MLVVRGTKKLRDRVQGASLEPNDMATNGIGEWFATALFWRPQVALLVNVQTFLPMFMPLAPTATVLSRIPEAIGSVLHRHGVNADFLAAEMEAMADVRLGPTNNRSVLGVMNEFAFHGEHVWRDGRVDLEELSVLMSWNAPLPSPPAKTSGSPTTSTRSRDCKAPAQKRGSESRLSVHCPFACVRRYAAEPDGLTTPMGTRPSGPPTKAELPLVNHSTIEVTVDVPVAPF